MQEPTRFKKESMKNTTFPYGLIFRRYRKRLAAVSLTWFVPLVLAVQH
jgi:hypothetical protein